ncbi:FKBP-type peptidyl-prolyl cis-trans isomerase [Cellulomonas sp. HZM]|uniref:FKBP-type peptidyl-prolyl cis-trans isomerase n=1 Tax=Cellulomonas sp. HZM TaxID=1454010 RepID=UPI00068BEE33|nr:FKBP-type peptidyl-prolyl cis-trans isomerase [Cellulomonas sp. HZM]
MRRPRGVWALALATLLLAGCSGADEAPPDITVSGDPGAAPTVTYITPLDLSSTYRATVWPGTGPELVDDKPILLDYWIEDGTDGSLVRESYSTSPVTRTLTKADLGTDLYETLRGQDVGARLVQATPGTGTGTSAHPNVTVVDVLPTRAQGQKAPSARDDLPAVKLSSQGAPTITATGGKAPTELITQPLIRGTGTQVSASDTVTVQYTGFSWKTGEAFDSTWEQGIPVSFSLQDVPTWSEALVDQPVGSQVMVVVPPTYPLGATQSKALKDQTVVFVIDILATSTPQGAGS